jgi:hypothetical protein
MIAPLSGIDYDFPHTRGTLIADYKTTLSLGGAYSIDEAFLRDIFEAAKKFGGTDVTVRIKLGAAHQFEATDLDEVLDDNLLRSHVITRITVYVNNYDVHPWRRFEFDARADIIGAPLTAEISGEQAACRDIRVQIEELSEAKRQWYSPFVASGNPSFYVVLSAIIVAIFAVPILVEIALYGRASTVVVQGLSIGVAILMPSLILLTWLRTILFPKLAVEIGRSRDITARASSLRRLLFGGILLALVIGVTSSVIANYLSK